MEELRRLFAFNRWANQRMLDAASELTAEELTRDMRSSFPSVLDTLAHMAVALAYLGRDAEARVAMRSTLQECQAFSIEFARKKLFYLESRQQIEMYLAGLEKAGAPP